MNRKIGLDLFRSAAIIGVLILHLGAQYNLALPYIYPFGFLGVELFFVLSGYLIGGILLRVIATSDGSVSLHRLGVFWIRRWFRTLPDYYVYLIIEALFSTTVIWQELPCFITFTQNLAWPFPKPPFFAISWSLAVEEIFYLAFPIAIVATALVTGRTRAAFFIAVGCLLVIPPVVRLAYSSGLDWDGDVRKIVIFRLDAPLWGVMIAALERYRPETFHYLRTRTCFLCGFVLLCLIAVFLGWWIDSGIGFSAWNPGVFNAVFFSLVSLVCSLMLPFCSQVTCSSRLLGILGYRISLYSYSIYLSHGFVLYHVASQFNRLISHIPYVWRYAGTFDKSFPEFCIVVLGIFGLSALSYHLLEYPMLRLRDRLFPAPREGMPWRQADWRSVALEESSGSANLLGNEKVAGRLR